MIRIFTIEDHPVIITGLKNLFRPSRDEIEIVGSATSVEETIDKVDPDSFDIFMLDLWIPSSHPLQNIKKLKEQFPGKPVVMFTSEDSSVWQKKMFEAGVKAYLLKSSDKSEIRSTLEKVSRGMTVFTGIIEDKEADKFRTAFTEPKYILTANQKELVIMLSKGLSQQQIAENKGTSISTVEKTLKHIRDRCDARNNAELIRILLERGVL